MRKHRIRILAGDKVTLEMSPYDLTKGRIQTSDLERAARGLVEWRATLDELIATVVGDLAKA